MREIFHNSLSVDKLQQYNICNTTIATLNTPEPRLFRFQPTNPFEVWKLFKNTDTKKAACFDNLSLRLVQFSADILFTPFLLQ